MKKIFLCQNLTCHLHKKKQRDDIASKCAAANVPLSLIRLNKYVNVEKQIDLVRHLSSNRGILSSLFFDSNLPTKSVLKDIIEICFEFLFPDIYQNDKVFTSANISRLTAYYVYKQPTIKELIIGWEASRINTKIRNVFKLLSRYFEFLLPKVLTCYATIYNHVSSRPIDISYILNKLEHGFDGQHEILMKEVTCPHALYHSLC
jgi:hypothetical protein